MGQGTDSVKRGMAISFGKETACLTLRAGSLVLYRAPGGYVLLGLEKKWGPGDSLTELIQGPQEAPKKPVHRQRHLQEVFVQLGRLRRGGRCVL